MILHFEDVSPDVRPTPIAHHVGPEQQRTVTVVPGIYPDGDPEGEPILTLSEQSAYDLGVQLLAHSSGREEADVRRLLGVLGFEP